MTPQSFTEKDIQLVAGWVHARDCAYDECGPTDEDEDTARAILAALAEAGRLQPQPAPSAALWEVRQCPSDNSHPDHAWGDALQCPGIEPDQVGAHNLGKAVIEAARAWYANGAFPEEYGAALCDAVEAYESEVDGG